jgi:hypothetical protein
MSLSIQGEGSQGKLPHLDVLGILSGSRSDEKQTNLWGKSSCAQELVERRKKRREKAATWGKEWGRNYHQDN